MGSAVAGDKEVGVDAGRPGACPVVEPSGEPDSYRAGKGDVAVVEGEAVVCDVGELEPDEVFGGEGVEGDGGNSEVDGGVGRVEHLADHVGVEGQGHGGIDRGGGHASGRVGEDQLAGVQTPGLLAWSTKTCEK